MSDGKPGRYLYAVVTATGANGLGGSLKGLDEAPVYTIAWEGLAAVVSDCQHTRLRPERRHMAAHQGVLRHLVAADDVLPMAFGMLVDADGPVEELLERNGDLLRRQLERVKGCVEMGVRLRWDVADIFQYFVNAHPELRAERDRVFRGRHNPTREEMIEIGRLFERLLASERNVHGRVVEEMLARHCREIHRADPREEREIVELACLIPRTNRLPFEEAVFEAARRFDDNFAFDYNGPWAPHHFVDLQLQVADAAA